MDSAALAAGAIAAVLAVTGPKGPYDIISATVGFVIVLVMIAYELPVKRSPTQNWAFAFILSLATVPITGFVLELILTAIRHEMSFIDFFNGRPESSNSDTAVPRWAIFLSWILLSFVYRIIAKRASNNAQ